MDYIIELPTAGEIRRASNFTGPMHEEIKDRVYAEIVRYIESLPDVKSTKIMGPKLIVKSKGRDLQQDLSSHNLRVIYNAAINKIVTEYRGNID